MKYGHFDDPNRAYVITDPIPPRPWINYLTNRRLSAFVSQNAGGLLWHHEPLSRRVTRYHYIPAPQDRPGFYLYVKDRTHGTLWNPHFAPTCTELDRYECIHKPGETGFVAEKDGVRVHVNYFIPWQDDVMVWQVKVENIGSSPVDLQISSYLEFGLLEFLRETLAWAYLKNHCAFAYDEASQSIRYDYHVFEAPYTPRMAFGCTADNAGFECSREVFVGQTGSLERPAALAPDAKLSNSVLPLGGHGCGVIGVDMALAPSEYREFAYRFAIADTWEEVDSLFAKYSDAASVEQSLKNSSETWTEMFNTTQCSTGDATVDRFINTWNPLNSIVTLQFARIISTDHVGMDRLRYRDTTQDALGVANIDPDFAKEKMHLVFKQQTPDGGGCFSFSEFEPHAPQDDPHRSDNGVWQIYTVNNILAETGDMSFLDEVIPYRNGSLGTVYDHTLRGLKHIFDRRGPNGLPTLFYADWNDSLAVFQDEASESVMLGMQMVYSAKEFRDLALRLGNHDDVAWCDKVVQELTLILNSPKSWDGEWYRRLLLSNGKHLGGAGCRQGSIYLNPQSWAVISGVGDVEGHGQKAMDSAERLLDSDCGLVLLAPPYTGIPEPEDPLLGSSPGTNENGSIFCHANTWAIIADCMLGNAERAFKYYRQMLPEVVASKVGDDHYAREPYAYASSIVGPASDRFGEAGISWLTGTASWMYIAGTHYLLGIRPTLDGLSIKPCLPESMGKVRVTRRFRGCTYDITIDNKRRGAVTLELDGKAIDGTVIPPVIASSATVICRC